METQFFPYGEAETAHLSARDPALGALISRLGVIRRGMTPDPFAALIDSIVSQQISGKAAETVYARLQALCPITPEGLAAQSPGEIQRCGVSFRKAEYIYGAALAAASGAVDFAAFPRMGDEEIIASLVALRGVGRWTAEMLLIFSLGRPDVISFDDLGIRRGMTRLYGAEPVTRAFFRDCAVRYSPYGSTASLYLWALAGEA